MTTDFTSPDKCDRNPGASPIGSTQKKKNLKKKIGRMKEKKAGQAWSMERRAAK